MLGKISRKGIKCAAFLWPITLGDFSTLILFLWLDALFLFSQSLTHFLTPVYKYIHSFIHLLIQ